MISVVILFRYYLYFITDSQIDKAETYDFTRGLLTSPTAYTEIAELADCSPNAAKNISIV
jgi:hypothetical protein